MTLRSSSLQKARLCQVFQVSLQKESAERWIVWQVTSWLRATIAVRIMALIILQRRGSIRNVNVIIKLAKGNARCEQWRWSYCLMAAAVGSMRTVLGFSTKLIRIDPAIWLVESRNYVNQFANHGRFFLFPDSRLSTRGTASIHGIYDITIYYTNLSTDSRFWLALIRLRHICRTLC